MILKVFTVFDSAAQAYLQPFFAPSQGTAIRSFMDACNDKNHEFSKHAFDYTMFLIGEYDDAAGLLIPTPPVRIMAAVEAVMKDVSPSKP